MSPFKSKAQMKYLFANEPKVAKEFASKTKSISALPNRINKKGTSKSLPAPTTPKNLGKRGLI